jgi:hypothetical protein
MRIHPRRYLPRLVAGLAERNGEGRAVRVGG